MASSATCFQAPGELPRGFRCVPSVTGSLEVEVLEQPATLRISGGERHLPSIARFGRLAYPIRGELTNRAELGRKRHGHPDIGTGCQLWERHGWQQTLGGSQITRECVTGMRGTRYYPTDFPFTGRHNHRPSFFFRRGSCGIHYIEQHIVALWPPLGMTHLMPLGLSSLPLRAEASRGK